MNLDGIKLCADGYFGKNGGAFDGVWARIWNPIRGNK
jgi:hypothetical protein